MAYRISTNVNAISGGVSYDYRFDILAFTRQFPQYPYTYVYDYTEGSSVGVPFAHAINDLINLFGFNPFNITKYYFTDGSTVTYANISSTCKSVASALNVDFQYMAGTISSFDFRTKTSNTSITGGMSCPTSLYNTSLINMVSAPGASLVIGTSDLTGSVYLIPSSSYDSANGFSEISYNDCMTYSYQMNYGTNPQGHLAVTQLSIGVSKGANIWQSAASLNNVYDELISDGSITGFDSNNPYGTVTSITGGGNGNPYMDLDTSEKVDFPDLPTLSAVSAGLITMYNPSLAQLQNLASFLWSQPFDIDTFKKLFANPMDAIIGLGIIPVQPSLSGSQNVKFGNVDSQVAMPKLSSQFVEFDCGSVTIDKWLDCFMDYDPYTKIQIYLPYSGIHSLSADDVIGKTLTLRYHIDCLTGGCAIMLYVSDKGVEYQWNGCCIANIPLTAINYSSAIQNGISAAISVGSIAIGAATGAAPLTIAGGTSLANNAANMALNSKPNFERSGNMGGAAGLLSVQTPYLIIERPNISVPDKLNKFTGNTSNVTFKLNELTGFTMIDLINLDDIPCTVTERNELLSILKEGVIF